MLCIEVLTWQGLLQVGNLYLSSQTPLPIRPIMITLQADVAEICTPATDDKRTYNHHHGNVAIVVLLLQLQLAGGAGGGA